MARLFLLVALDLSARIRDFVNSESFGHVNKGLWCSGKYKLWSCRTYNSGTLACISGPGLKCQNKVPRVCGCVSKG